jgi:hypothetical protein
LDQAEVGDLQVVSVEIRFGQGFQQREIAFGEFVEFIGEACEFRPEMIRDMGRDMMIQARIQESP